VELGGSYGGEVSEEIDIGGGQRGGGESNAGTLKATLLHCSNQRARGNKQIKKRIIQSYSGGERCRRSMQWL